MAAAVGQQNSIQTFDQQLYAIAQQVKWSVLQFLAVIVTFSTKTDVTCSWKQRPCTHNAHCFTACTVRNKNQNKK